MYIGDRRGAHLSKGKDMSKRELFMSNVNTMLRGFIIDCDEDIADEKYFENSITGMRSVLNAKQVEITVRLIRDRKFTFICGRKAADKVTAVDDDNNVVLEGTFIVAGLNLLPGGYEIRSLSDEELRFIKTNLGLMYMDDGNGGGFNIYCLKHVSPLGSKKKEAYNEEN